MFFKKCSPIFLTSVAEDDFLTLNSTWQYSTLLFNLFLISFIQVPDTVSHKIQITTTIPELFHHLFIIYLFIHSNLFNNIFETLVCVGITRTHWE